MKTTEQQFTSFLKRYGISQNYAALRLGESKATVSRVLTGKTDGFTPMKLESIRAKMVAWINEHERAEDHLYDRIFPIVSDVPKSVVASAFRKIFRDIDGSR